MTTVSMVVSATTASSITHRITNTIASSMMVGMMLNREKRSSVSIAVTPREMARVRPPVWRDR